MSKILLVEDNEMNRDMLSRRLAKKGHEVVIAVVIFAILIAYTVLSGEIGGVLTQAFQGLVIVVAGFIFTASFFIVTGGFAGLLGWRMSSCTES